MDAGVTLEVVIGSSTEMPILNYLGKNKTFIERVLHFVLFEWVGRKGKRKKQWIMREAGYFPEMDLSVPGILWVLG